MKNEGMAEDPEGGRAQFQDALKVFAKYPSSNTYVIESMHFLTEIDLCDF